MTKPTGGSAFACAAASPCGATHLQEGMTLRDYMAAAALQIVPKRTIGTNNGEHLMAADAYALADAMLTEREK